MADEKFVIDISELSEGPHWLQQVAVENADISDLKETAPRKPKPKTDDEND